MFDKKSYSLRQEKGSRSLNTHAFIHWVFAFCQTTASFGLHSARSRDSMAASPAGACSSSMFFFLIVLRPLTHLIAAHASEKDICVRSNRITVA
eukprot:Selendium_serpulae@DN10567_c0_g1_i1.p1